MPKKINITYTGQTKDEVSRGKVCYKCKYPEDVNSDEYTLSLSLTRLCLLLDYRNDGKIIEKFFLCRGCIKTLVKLGFSTAGNPQKKEPLLENSVTLDSCAICNRASRDKSFIFVFDEHTQLDRHRSDTILLKHNMDINNSICQECEILIDIAKRTSFDNDDNNGTYFPKDTRDDSKTFDV